MKIFYICYENVSIQAAWTTHIKEVISHLTKLGNEVTLFCPAIGRFEKEVDCKTVYIPTLDIRILNEYIYYLVLFFYLLYYQFKSKAEIFYLREMGLSLSVALVSKICKIPHVIEVNGAPLEEFQKISTGSLRKFVYKKFQSFNFSGCNRIVVVDDILREYIVQHYPSAKLKIVTIGNGVNTDIFRPMEIKTCQKTIGLSHGYDYITYVGSFYPHHSVDRLIELFCRIIKRSNKVRLLLIGDGYEKEAIVNLIKQRKVEDQVKCIGSVLYETVPFYINASTLCIQFLNGSEHRMSIKILEYFSCGIPVVVNKREAGKNPFSDLKVGIEVDLHDLDGAADQIIRLLKEEAVRKNMGQRARQIIEKEYSWNKTAKKIQELFYDVIK